MAKLMSWFNSLLSGWCILLMGAAGILVIVTVLLRYIFNLTFVWAEELVTVVFLATTYFGAILSSRENEHIGISVVIDQLPFRLRRWFGVFSALVIVVVQFIIFKASLVWISKVGNVLTAGLRIPIKVFYFMIPISCLFITFYEVYNAARRFMDSSPKGIVLPENDVNC